MPQVLRDSLGGNCKTVMVATMHPGLAHTDESISTCRFAQRVAKVTNVAEINEEVDQAALIERLKQECRGALCRASHGALYRAMHGAFYHGALHHRIVIGAYLPKQENRKLRDEGGMADDAAEAQLGPEELASLHAAVRSFVRHPDAQATVTWPAAAPGKRRRGAHVRHALWILKSLLQDARGGRRGGGARRRVAVGGSGGDGGGGGSGDAEEEDGGGEGEEGEEGEEEAEEEAEGGEAGAATRWDVPVTPRREGGGSGRGSGRSLAALRRENAELGAQLEEARAQLRQLARAAPLGGGTGADGGTGTGGDGGGDGDIVLVVR